MQNSTTESECKKHRLHIHSWLLLSTLFLYSLFIFCSHGFGNSTNTEKIESLEEVSVSSELQNQSDRTLEANSWYQIQVQKNSDHEAAVIKNIGENCHVMIVITSNGNPLDMHEISIDLVPSSSAITSISGEILVEEMPCIPISSKSQAVKPVRFEKLRVDFAKAPREKEFTIPVFYDDHSLPATTTHVRSKVAASGNWVTVYVDECDSEMFGPNRLAREVVSRLESFVAPFVNDLFNVQSNDQNRPLSILLTNRFAPNQSLSQRDGHVPIRGFVHRSKCGDGSKQVIICLDSRISASSELQAFLFHEYTHVVTNRVDRLKSRMREDWMSEALAHTVEIRSRSNLSNLTPRITAFLENPHRKPLRIKDFRSSGFFRDPVSRGAGALFLDYCVSRFGEEVFSEIIYTDLNSIQALETVSQMEIIDLLQAWGLSLADLNWENQGSLAVRFIEFDGEMMSQQIAGSSNLFVSCPQKLGHDKAIRITATEGSNIRVAVKPMSQGL